MECQKDKLHDNTYLCARDMTSATDEQRIAWLSTIIHNELARGEEKDEALICECAEYLELLAPESTVSPEECEERLRALLADTPRGTTRKKRARGMSRHEPRGLPIRRRILVRIAAIASVFLMIATLSTQTYAHAIQLLDHHIYEEAIRKEVATMEEEYLAAHASESASAGAYCADYRDLSEFFAKHGPLSFHYPHPLPQNQAIRSIRMIYCSEERWLVIFTFRTPSIRYYTVECLPQSARAPEAGENALRFTVDGRDYLTAPEGSGEKDLFKTVCADEHFLYTLVTDGEDTAHEILSLTEARAYRYTDMEALREDWEHLPPLAWPEPLPAGFTVGSVTLTYDTQAAWRIVVQLKYHNGARITANHSVTVTPAADHDFGSRLPTLSNERTDIYIPYSSQSETAGLCQAECIVGDLKYETKIFGYNPFMTFLDHFFGPF